MERRADSVTLARNVCLGLGSNLGDRNEHLRQAVKALLPKVIVVRLSAVYDTAPVLVTDQPRFHNIVAMCDTTLDPHALLAYVKRIEMDLGRVPGTRYGPRVIDVDILIYGQIVLETPDLTIPHPRLVERGFVLAPLAEIAPDLRHPVLGLTMRELASVVAQQDVRAIGPLFETGR
jgi:2-amino-4-hydroxy-6-hydroxymethyldihydropteridine diphosphokinase